MSILAIRKWQQFSAPVFIGKKSSITGSWTRCHQVSPYELAMAPNILFHLRLSTWKQECPSGVTDVCVDWCVYNEHSQLKHTIEIKVSMIDADFAEILNTQAFMTRIEETLNQSPHIGTIAGALDLL